MPDDFPSGKEPEERRVGCLGRSCRPMYGFRFVILVLTNLCLTSICSNMIAFNFTMICMTREETMDVGNGTQTTAYVPYTQDEKSILIWAVSFGSIFATFPFSWLYTKYGAQLVFLSAGAISVLSTALIPFSADLGIVAFVAVRALQGVSFAANFAAIGMVCSRWASLTENGFFLSCMTNFSQIAVIITNPISAWLCESSLGWQSVYYVHAAVGPVLWLLWYFVYSDYPDRHKCLGTREVEKIQEGKSKSHLEIHGFMPYK
ncbi:major facilitator superfamily transporter, partial [Aphelenchoides avenae]